MKNVIAPRAESLAMPGHAHYKNLVIEKRPSEMVAVLFLELPSKNKEAAVGDPRRLFLCAARGGHPLRPIATHSQSRVYEP